MSWIHALRERIANGLGGGERDGDLEEEIAYHIELETARQLDAGCDPAVARVRAIARFGDPRTVTEATRSERGAPLMEGGMQDFQWALRSLRKSGGFTALALFTMMLGIGVTATAFAVLDTVLLRPLRFADADRLVLIRELTAKHDTRPPSYPNFDDWRARARSFDGVISAMYPYPTTVWPGAEGSDPVRIAVLGVSREFLSVLGVKPLIGREFTDDENKLGGPQAVMVSYEFWQAQMGARTPLGTLRFGDTPSPVIGVLPPGFRFVMPADAYVGHERAPGTVRSAHNYLVAARLKPGVSLESARAEMATLSSALYTTYRNETEAANVDITPLRDYVVGDYRTMLIIVFAAAALVLFIACTNLMSAQLARGLSRQREMVVRAALGASPRRLTRLLLVESGLLVAAGASLGLLLATLLTRTIKALGANLVPRLNELTIDARVVVFVGAIAVGTGLLVGIYPALRFAKRDGVIALREARGGGAAVHASVWRLLVGFEIALAVVLLVGSTLLIRTLHNILAADTGFVSERVATAAITPRRGDFERLDQIKGELRSIPGVEGVAFTTQLPLAWGNMSAPVRRPGDPIDHDWRALAGFRIVSPEYFSVLRQPLLRGREFSTTDRDGTEKVAIITSGIGEKLWPGEDPLGKRIATNYLGDQWLTIVGVVTEASIWSMPRGAQHEIYVPLAQQSKQVERQGQIVAVLRTAGDPSALVPAIKSRMREVAPNSPALLGTMTERIARTVADRRFAMLALTTFGLVALLLAAVGIYGVIWYIVTTRTREIGIRMALGATAARVRGEVLRGAVTMTIGGIAAGALASAFATKYLQATLYGVSRLDPMTYLVGAAVALCTVLLGAYIPARRSSRVDPMVAIRDVR